MIAPDSWKMMPALVSPIVGTRPLMLIFSNGSFFRSPLSEELLVLCFVKRDGGVAYP